MTAQFPRVTAELAAEYVRDFLERPCTATTVRVWAHRHPDRFGDHGKAGRARLFDLGEVHTYVTGESFPGAT